MGNNPSTQAKSNTASPAGSTHGAPLSSSSGSRREPKLRDNIQAQRVAAPPEPSLAQARGTNVTHRTKTTSSHPGRYENNSPSSKDQSGSYQSRASDRERPVFKNEPSKPVAVPIPSNNATTDSTTVSSPYATSQPDPSAPPFEAMSYHLTRPPRLPLPIEEEVHTPGSTLLRAEADSELPDLAALDEALPRQGSGLSNNNTDDEDDEELPIDKTKPVVPTEISWIRGGEKVYVTGSIFQWSRKSKLSPVKGKPGHFAAIIHVRPGTHHVRFIVDTVMSISPDLPTTVDFGNNLVNYIEVSADDVVKDPKVGPEALGTPVLEEPQAIEAPPSKETQTVTEEIEEKVIVRTIPASNKSAYIDVIPQYLVDLDKAEDHPAYRQAATAIEQLPTPPSLPGFLAKPILNAATPMKDDNSVLNMPNHTVLNHLATSSIKNDVLAVSGTTRYKRKYVTTIMYKPTSDS